MESKTIDLFSGKNIPELNKEKHVAIIEEIVEKIFKESLKDDFSEEESYYLACEAWNGYYMSVAMGVEIFDEVLDVLPSKKYNVQLWREVFKLLEKYNIDEYCCIRDFELIKENGEMKFQFSLQNKEDALQMLFDEFDAELPANSDGKPVVFGDENGNELSAGFIDRDAMVITAKKAFLKYLEENGIETSERELTSIYLVPVGIIYTKDWVKLQYADFFTAELFRWEVEEEKHPKKLTYTLFKSFFNVSCTSEIVDMQKAPIEKY